MRTIWKYTLDLHGGPVHSFRISASDAIHVGEDPKAPGCPTVWMKVDTDGPSEPVVFEIAGTGLPIPEGTHIGSAVCGSGFVWHVFMRWGER